MATWIRFPTSSVCSLLKNISTPYTGQTMTMPDHKLVRLAGGQNAACDFVMSAKVAVAAQIGGFVLDDKANEFDPFASTFGEKYLPPFLPVAVVDWKGHILNLVLTDRWGASNGLLPSTFSNNGGIPSGILPNMVTVIINYAGPIPNPDFGQMGEPEFLENTYFNRKYSQFSHTVQYMPRATTYLDTPVVPLGAEPEFITCDDGFGAQGPGSDVTIVGLTVTSGKPEGEIWRVGTDVATVQSTVDAALEIQRADERHGRSGSCPKQHGYTEGRDTCALAERS